MAVVWTAIDKSTLDAYRKGASDMTKRGRWRLRRLEQKGRITYNHGGIQPNWAVEIVEHDVTARTRGQVRHFEALDPWERLQDTWSHFEATDLLPREDELQNRGDAAMIKHGKTIPKRLSKNMRTRFCSQIYQDGNASGNTNLLHGLLTMVSTTSASFTAATDVIVKNGTGEYGTLETAPGNYSANWTSDITTSPNATLATDWPDGQGDPGYDFNSCKLVPINSANWDTDGATDATSNLIPAIRRTKIWNTRGSDPEDAADFLTLGSVYMNAFKNAIDPRLDVVVPVKGTTELGLPEVLRFEGLEITTEYDCPSEVGWMENLDHQELQSQNSDLFDVTAPWMDKDIRSTKFVINFDGQMLYEPMFFAYLYEATEA